MSRSWIAVASAEHVRRGVVLGIMQVGHGKAAPIRPLLDLPGFALSGKGWGARLRFGLLRIDEASMDAIAAAMEARPANG